MLFKKIRYLLQLTLLSLPLLTFAGISYCQSPVDSLFNKIDPARLSTETGSRIEKLESSIISKSHRALDRLRKLEEKIYRSKLRTKDSSAAKASLADIDTRYKNIQEKLKQPTLEIPVSAKKYIPYLDSLKTMFKFLSQESGSGDIKKTLSGIESLENRMQQAEEIKRFLNERRKLIVKQLGQTGLGKKLKQYNKHIYYYSEQLKEFREILSDPKKIERKALALLQETKFFQEFMQKNNMLASLFKMPGDPGNPASQPGVAGLQTRAQVNNLIQQQFGTPNAQLALQQNIQNARAELQILKTKIDRFSSGSSDDILPEGFTPNTQKTRSFLNRLEYGVNIQTQKGSTILPITSDLAVSAGYKLNDKSTIGIGAAYKLGLGNGWNDIKFTNQGAGLRSFFDLKLKGSLWLSSGYEMNYLPALQQWQSLQTWQRSGLVGVSKVISVKSKFFKKTKLQLLWDYLSYEQKPRPPAILFRVGYNVR